MDVIDPMGSLTVPEGSVITPLYGRTVQVVTPAGPVFQVCLMGLNGASSGGLIERLSPRSYTLEDMLSSLELDLPADEAH